MSKPLPNAFRRFNQYFHETSDILGISLMGIGYVATAYKTIEYKVKHNIGKTWTLEEGAKAISDAKRRAEFADREIKANFPTLHAHYLIASWGAFEVFMRDLAVELIKENPSLLKAEPFAAIKIPARRMLDEDDRIAITVELFLQKLKSKRPSTFSRFEILLNAVGLTGQAPIELKERFDQMQRVRNLLVHKNGIVDKRFKRLCPNIAIEIGQRMTVTNKDYLGYMDVFIDYTKILIARHKASQAAVPASSA